MKKWGKVAGALVMLVVIISLGASALVKDSQPLKKAKPNVVIILSDDQGFGDVSYHEHPKEIKTPAIDKLAAQGVVFTNGYASAFVCAPTRAGLLTGRYQQRFGFYRASDSRVGMPLNEITLADACLIPQVYNSKRFKVDLSMFPNIQRVSANAGQLEAFKKADPDQQEHI